MVDNISTPADMSTLPQDSITPQQALDTIAIVTSKGTIKIVLFNETPLHKANFLKLCNEGYYDGLLFHRVIPNFMIQGGDPNSKNAPKGQMLGNGGPNYTIPAEFNQNLKHTRGALAAARTGDEVNPQRESSGSQFYICHVATPFLDMQYTVFGKTVDGFDVIDLIANAQKDQYDRPVEDIKILSTKVLTKKAEPKADEPNSKKKTKGKSK
ncbi:MAG: peptidylprolyl isomerase [Bacteroidia bacterium]|nr:peptidylprolyl isomerase [Bacteroidia bacterium]